MKNTNRIANSSYALIISRAIPSKKYPLQGIFEFDQAKALASNGQKVVFLSLDLRSIRRKRKSILGISKQEKEGIICYQASFPLGRVPLSLSKSIAIPLLKKAVKFIIREYGKPRLMHAHFTEIGYYSSFIKDKFDLTLVLTEHNSAVNKNVLDNKTKKIASKAYEKADKLIAVSNTLSENIYKHFKVNAEIICNVIDTSIYKNIITSSISDTSFEFVSVGGLIYRKGFDILLRGFKEAFSGQENVKLTIFGEGAEKDNLIKLSKELNLDKQVLFYGQQSRNFIAEKFAQSDCFVLTSRRETFGVVYIEAMAGGLPVIATVCGGPECFVNKENGILIDIDNIEQTRDALLYMHKNIKIYDKNNIKKFVQNNFSQEVIATQIINLYNAIN